LCCAPARLGEVLMRVGLVAPPCVAVPPPAYGGTEAVVDRLARGLVRAGHEVRLFTIGESTCPVPSSWRYVRAMPMENSMIEAAHALSAYDALDDMDVVHDHTVLGPLLARRRRRGRQPVVSTVHGAFTPDARRIYGAAAGAAALVCISKDQRRSAPEIPVAAVIHHGLDLADFPMGSGAGGYLLFVGRMSPDKGVHRAIAVARATGRRLLIAAKMRDPVERAFFRERVRPLLGDGVEYVGEVGPGERLELLQGAVALLNPIQWAEPFGLVMIEALACGTPVIASAIGSAPEIVRKGRTGFLCADDDEFVRAVRRVERLRRQDCRDAVQARFTTDRMVRDHLLLYESVLGAGSSRPRAAAGVLARAAS
jgi:glycosyltransferase involved in cell wall biosynthesis